MTLPPAADLGRMALALAAGALGGLGASAISMPLPWMLGAMVACTLLALVKAPIEGPMPIRPPMIMVLGVMLGSGFTPSMLERAGEWAASLALLGAYIAVVGASFGGDDRRIVLTHASRILLAVLAIPIFFRLTTDIDMTDRSRFGVSMWEVGLADYAILVACAVVGWPLARLVRLPAALLVGPMLVSAGVHLAGLSAAQPPLEIVNLAQWIIGTVIGCRFVGVHRREILRVIKLSVGSTAMMLAVTFAFALLLHWLVGARIDTVVLAYAPGGLAEMSLVALALGTDVAFVATHHVVRIMLVVVAAPTAFRWLHRPQRETEPDAP